MVCAPFGVPGRTKEGAVKWIIRPTVTKDWRYAPVVQASQVGYHPGQKKVAVIELDKRDTDFKQPALYRIAADGRKLVKQQAAKDWEISNATTICSSTSRK